MNKTAVFVMPLKISGGEMELKFFRAAVESIRNQTDPDWVIALVDDYSDDQRVYDVIDEMKTSLKEKLHVIYSDKNYGTGLARNKGVLYAAEIGAPFILFLDADDLADPRRLELTRKAFEDEKVNVVYTSFDVIDENNQIVPHDEITLPVREIIDGHKKDVVEGENAWIAIATKKKYTNLTSCTAVRTTLAAEELFPPLSVSEDCHTWFRYAAHPGKFVFLREIKGCYRICRGVASRSRSLHADFYEKQLQTDIDGFESAVRLAKKYGAVRESDVNDIRVAFHVRLALNLFHGNSEACCKKSLSMAAEISREKAIECIEQLDCLPEEKIKLKGMLS